MPCWLSPPLDPAWCIALHVAVAGRNWPAQDQERSGAGFAGAGAAHRTPNHWPPCSTTGVFLRAACRPRGLARFADPETRCRRTRCLGLASPLQGCRIRSERCPHVGFRGAASAPSQPLAVLGTNDRESAPPEAQPWPCCARVMELGDWGAPSQSDQPNQVPPHEPKRAMAKKGAGTLLLFHQAGETALARSRKDRPVAGGNWQPSQLEIECRSEARERSGRLERQRPHRALVEKFMTSLCLTQRNHNHSLGPPIDTANQPWTPNGARPANSSRPTSSWNRQPMRSRCRTWSSLHANRPAIAAASMQGQPTAQRW